MRKFFTVSLIMHFYKQAFDFVACLDDLCMYNSYLPRLSAVCGILLTMLGLCLKYCMLLNRCDYIPGNE